MVKHNGSTYSWQTIGGDFTSINLNQASIHWTAKDSGVVLAVETDVNGCPSDTMILKVRIGRPIIDSIYGSLSVCPNAKGIDYWVTEQTGSQYYWSVEGGVQSFGGNTSHIRIDWGNKGGGLIKVVEITKDGCISDTLKLKVLKDYVLYTSPIRGDTSLCAYTPGRAYEVTYSNGSTYDWKVLGGTIISGNGGPKIIVDWDQATTAVISVTETAYDNVNNEPCKGIPVTLLVYVHPLPNTSPITGIQEICAKEFATYSVKGLPGSMYKWEVSDSTGVQIQNQGADTSRMYFIKPGTYQIKLTEITKDSCQADSRYLNVKVYPVPNTSDILGPQIVCYPHLNGIEYHVNGTANSSFQWDIDGGTIVSGAGSDHITVNWFLAGNRQIRVLEVSDFGCKGQPKTLDVKVDSLAIDLNLVTTAKGDDKVIELYWSKRNDQFFDGYFRIYRNEDGNDAIFKVIDSVPGSQTFYTDRNVETGKYAYRYYIQAVNSCGTKILTNIHKSVLLRENTFNDSTLTMFWNRYEGWPGGVNYYYLNKSMNYDTAMQLYNLSKDTLLYVVTSLDGYRECYRIAAEKAQDHSIISWSNKLCIDLEPHLFVPNVFTPGNYDFLNNTFRVVATNFKSFNITIFNRWGERIFTSDSPDKQWDGTFHGAPCQEGVYLYMIEVKGSKTNIYKNGTVNLLK
jgi:gliding motility-associated-like protein